MLPTYLANKVNVNAMNRTNADKIKHSVPTLLTTFGSN